MESKTHYEIEEFFEDWTPVKHILDLDLAKVYLKSYKRKETAFVKYRLTKVVTTTEVIE